MAAAVGANVGGSPLNFMEKYNDERDKRVRAEGTKQYIDLERSNKFRGFLEDPWAKRGQVPSSPVPDGGHTKVLIVGAGFGGVIFAVRLIQAGFKPEDLLIVDSAAGFGGTCHKVYAFATRAILVSILTTSLDWNRYPGLQCDVESYIYLPFLEEMGYMPKRRYASGVEIREYIENVCTKYGLHDRAMLQTGGERMAWDDGKHEWNVRLNQTAQGDQPKSVNISADFVVITPGLLHKAKIPDVEGIQSFNGHSFHTSRWDYDYTGGSPEKPEMANLGDKKVAIIGTGATAVQCVPHLAKYAKELYVFQRTPSSIDTRGNHDTDPEKWRKDVANKEGWQKERQLNFQAFLNNVDPKPEVDMVDDQWSKAPAYSALMGTANKPVTMETVAQHIGELHAMDYPRTERIRQRAAEVVQDQKTASSLQAWYPTWCKRPCFHDEYLQAFNLPSVKLIDTEGAGIDRIIEKGIQFKGQDYDFDLVIWSTGFRSPALGTAAGKADMEVIGKSGKSMEQINNEGGLLTLHGVASNGFPNVFWSGPLQAGAAANNTFTIDVLATHAAYIMSEAVKKAPNGEKAIVEPTTEAQDQWAMQILMGATTFAGVSGCTPSYLNAESERDKLPMEQQMAAAKFSPWPYGFANFVETIEAWRSKGHMEGMTVTVAA